MRRFIVAVGLGLLTVPASAFAAPEQQPTIAALKGRCSNIVAMDKELNPKLCNPNVINMTLPNGREGFLFTLQGADKSSVTVAFFGNGQREIHKDGDHVVLPIDSVNFSFQGLDHYAAAGSCQFANPTQGVPVPVVCTADTKEGKFVAEFMSDGSAPHVVR